MGEVTLDLTSALLVRRSRLIGSLAVVASGQHAVIVSVLCENQAGMQVCQCFGGGPMLAYRTVMLDRTMTSAWMPQGLRNHPTRERDGRLTT